MQELSYQIESLRSELIQIKGPLVDKISRVSKENESFMRELKRTQSANREILTEYKSVVTHGAKNKANDNKSHSCEKELKLVRGATGTHSADKYHNYFAKNDHLWLVQNFFNLIIFTHFKNKLINYK